MIRTTFDGILFIEGECKEAQQIKPISVRIHGFFSQAQLKSLDDVKKDMALLAREAGGNAIIRFTYGQRSTFWTTLLGVDDVSWYGEGIIARL
jgi:hypothetical protein